MQSQKPREDQPNIRPELWLGLLLLLACLIRIPLFLGSNAIFWTDSYAYFDSAKGYMANGFAFPDRPVVHTPLYPLFLAAALSLGDSYQVGRFFLILQHLLGVLATVIVYFIARSLLPSRTAFLVAVVFSTHTLLLYYECVIQTEVLFVLVLAAFLGYLCSSLNSSKLYAWILCGVLAGLCTLTRPVAFYLPVVLSPLILFTPQLRWQRFRAIGLMLGAYYLTLLPWMCLNYQQYNFFGVSRGVGINLFMRSIDLDRLDPPAAVLNSRVGRLYRMYRRTDRHMYFAVKRNLVERFHYSVPQADDAMFQFAKATVLAHPVKFLTDSIHDFYEIYLRARRSISFTCHKKRNCRLSIPRSSSVYRRKSAPKPFATKPPLKSRKIRGWIYGYFKNFELPMQLITALAIFGVACATLRPQYLKAKLSCVYLTTAVLIISALYFPALAVLLNRPEDRYRLPIDFILILYAGVALYFMTVWFKLPRKSDLV